MKTFLSVIYLIVIFIPIFLLATILTALSAIIGCLCGKRSFWGYIPPRYWGKVACRLALCRVKVRTEVELDPNQSYVFVANHQGAFDIFLIYGYLGTKTKWVQKQSLRKIPLVGKACEVIGHVYVDNSSPRAIKRTIDKAKRELEDGVSMTIFPEGSRTSTGKMGKFKKGAFVIAEDMHLPIVPLTLNGPIEVMKIGSYMINLGKKLELVIHKPIETEGLTDEKKAELMNKTRDVIYSDLWDKYK
ncbi:1-acyl-sn-glycerol-3-phosphate acyltransferase [Dysgonomonas sp. PH5-45]|uniref:lysophospholipid acyltransferase family protein n=1 Tax=unclassified Dysgonomonas TaxID=2630389 RepID=UPI0024764B3C|nr:MULTISPECIES: lysophospholipid acyltransferase family protein [unclassified Dysgonomonas]MDH6355042.1 1-acyl-sn-glycerol-3-phosphate acyltransferase [Dysgonomonas sp. PH5-45]MDH6387942.1 1-acyl-sn-glycerol-3-phosphate acyltransferase [Dysgonomonas sp. PH5-37]